MRIARNELGRPWIIAHRGASGDAPENSMASFKLALQQGADMLETDVQLTADGVPVLIHDATLDRTTNGRGLVKNHSLEQIKALDAGSWFGQQFARETVPTLDELLEWASGKLPVTLEIKNGPVYYPGIEARLVESIQHHDMVDKAMVISFDHLAIRRAKELCPEMLCGVLYACRPVEPAALALAAGAEAVVPHWSNLTADAVEKVHARGLLVTTWVVDGEREMGWMLSLGVDGIATNYPGRLVALLRRGAGFPLTE